MASSSIYRQKSISGIDNRNYNTMRSLLRIYSNNRDEYIRKEGAIWAGRAGNIPRLYMMNARMLSEVWIMLDEKVNSGLVLDMKKPLYGLRIDIDDIWTRIKHIVSYKYIKGSSSSDNPDTIVDQITKKKYLVDFIRYIRIAGKYINSESLEIPLEKDTRETDIDLLFKEDENVEDEYDDYF